MLYNNSMSMIRIRQFTNKRKRLIITNVFLALFLLLGIGYSTLNTNLNIIGDLLVKKYTEPIIITTSQFDKSAFRSDTYREKIKTITLDSNINPPENVIESWDIGAAQNGNVMAYITQNSDDNTMYDLYIQGKKHLYANEDSSYLFYDLKGVDQINGLDNLDISRVKNMRAMFMSLGKNSLSFKLNLGNNFDTSSVTDMSLMFSNTGYNSTSFTLDLGENFDTSNVTDMSSMFYVTGYSSTVFVLNLGDKFNTSKVTNMNNMFSNAGYQSTVFT